MQKFSRATVLSLMLQIAYADPMSGSSPPGRPSGPPPEAVSACSGKSVGDSVTFTLPDGKQISGKCQMDNGVLAARPDQTSGPPPGDRSGNH